MKGLSLFLVASMTALGSLIVEYLQQASHTFQSAILVAVGLFAAVWLFWCRRDDLLAMTLADEQNMAREHLPGDPNTIVFAGAVGLALAFLAQLAHWPYLGWLAFLYWLGLVAYAEFGKPGVIAIRPILILLIFLNPIPLPLEPWNSFALQSASTSLTMIMLDFLRIFFFSEGNTLGLISQQKPFPELFHGVSWLFPTVFVVIAWGIHFRYSWLRTVVNVCQAIGWVIVANAASAAILLANKDSGGNWLDFPSIIALWNYITLASVLFLTWSGDQFLASTLRPKDHETHFWNTGAEETVRLLPLRWKPSGLQYAILLGLLVVFGLSLRLRSDYRPGGVPSIAATQDIQLPVQVESWSVQKAVTSESQGWLDSDSSVQAWTLEHDGKKLKLEVRASASLPKPYLYSWLWCGWRLETAPEFLGIGDMIGRPMLAELVRLPGEVVTVIALGSDQYGSLGIANSPLETWDQLPSLAQRNLLRALGGRTWAPQGGDFPLPASHAVLLTCASSKSLTPEKKEEMKQVWDAVYPILLVEINRLRSRE